MVYYKSKTGGDDGDVNPYISKTGAIGLEGQLQVDNGGGLVHLCHLVPGGTRPLMESSDGY
jgi:hypothetical protein